MMVADLSLPSFSKGKSNEELGEYLKNTFQGGKWLGTGRKEISAWYSDKGIYF